MRLLDLTRVLLDLGCLLWIDQIVVFVVYNYDLKVVCKSHLNFHIIIVVYRCLYALAVRMETGCY